MVSFCRLKISASEILCNTDTSVGSVISFSFFILQVTSDVEPRVLCLKHAIKHIRARGSPAGFRILSRYDTVSV